MYQYNIDFHLFQTDHCNVSKKRSHLKYFSNIYLFNTQFNAIHPLIAQSTIAYLDNLQTLCVAIDLNGLIDSLNLFSSFIVNPLVCVIHCITIITLVRRNAVLRRDTCSSCKVALAKDICGNDSCKYIIIVLYKYLLDNQLKLITRSSKLYLFYFQLLRIIEYV